MIIYYYTQVCIYYNKYVCGYDKIVDLHTNLAALGALGGSIFESRGVIMFSISPTFSVFYASSVLR